MTPTVFLTIMALFLFGISVVDMKFKQIPSALLTALLIMTAFNRVDYLQFGVLTLLYALFLYELGFIGGVADIKIITLFGVLAGDLLGVGIIMLVVVGIGTLYKIFCKVILKKKAEIAFIPALFLSFIALWILGVLL